MPSIKSGVILIRYIVFFTFVFVFTTLKAQTPITNTTFYHSYLEFAMVKKAAESGVMTNEIANFLIRRKVALDLKAAIINALSFEILGKNNTDRFVKFLLEVHKADNLSDIEDNLNADVLMCIAYLLVMDDYFSPERAIPYIEKAKRLKPDDYTINMIHALIVAQKEFHLNKCRAWQVVYEVDSNPKLKDVMFKESRDAIMGFMVGYRSACND